MSLFKCSFLRVLAVVAGSDDGLTVVDEQDIDVLCDGRSTAASLSHILLNLEQDVTAVLEGWRRGVRLCPPKSVLGKVDIRGDMTVLHGPRNIHTTTHVHRGTTDVKRLTRLVGR